MRYREVDRITGCHDNHPVHLKLQERLGVPPVQYHCLSWRTLYPRRRANRRFYRLKGSGFWTIPASLALDLMMQANGRGWLDGAYHDPQERCGGPDNDVIDSRELGARERRDVFESITCEDGEPDWGDDPLFVIIQVPDKRRRWRKIMIVDSERKLCTFRSTTTDLSYKPVIADYALSPWRMDNSMQDAGAAMIRKFLSVLEAES